jgi:uridine kinase
MLRDIASVFSSIKRDHPTRVGIDGTDGAGKTTFADQLVLPLQDLGRAVIRASIDGFHRPREDRYRRGRDSPEGFYHDSFDYQRLRSELLLPLGPGGDLRYRANVFDYKTDSFVETPKEVAARDAVLLFDGVFLMRPELIDCWDFKILLILDEEEQLRRVVKRDQDLFGEEDEVVTRYRKRYLPGQAIYFSEVKPQQLADIVIDNTIPDSPKAARTSGGASGRALGR